MRDATLWVIIAFLCGGVGLMLLSLKFKGITIEEEDAEALDAISGAEKPYIQEEK